MSCLIICRAGKYGVTHNAPLKGNTMQEAGFIRNQIIVPESIVSRQYVALRYPDH